MFASMFHTNDVASVLLSIRWYIMSQKKNEAISCSVFNSFSTLCFIMRYSCSAVRIMSSGVLPIASSAIIWSAFGMSPSSSASSCMLICEPFCPRFDKSLIPCYFCVWKSYKYFAMEFYYTRPASLEYVWG